MYVVGFLVKTEKSTSPKKPCILLQFAEIRPYLLYFVSGDIIFAIGHLDHDRDHPKATRPLLVSVVVGGVIVFTIAHAPPWCGGGNASCKIIGDRVEQGVIQLLIFLSLVRSKAIHLVVSGNVISAITYAPWCGGGSA